MTDGPNPDVTPEPVATTTQLSVVSVGGSVKVEVDISTPTGKHVVFYEPETARAIGEALVRAGTLGATGLLLASSVPSMSEKGTRP